MKILLLTAAVALAGACFKADPDERPIIATIEGVPLYSDDFHRELKRFQLDDEDALPSPSSDAAQKRALLDNIIERKLVLRAAETVNIVVASDELEAAYQRVRAGWKEGEFEALLQRKDMTPTELKSELRDQLIVRKFFRDQVFARVAVTDQEIEDRIGRSPALLETPEQVRARHIVVKTEEQARGIHNELKAGLAFEDAAMKYSLSPEGRTGGDLGFFARGSMPRIFDEVCFTLAPGAVSAVVPSEYGFHLFKVIERRAAVPRPIELVREQVEASLRSAKEREAQAAKVAELRGKAKVVVQEEQLARIY